MPSCFVDIYTFHTKLDTYSPYILNKSKRKPIDGYCVDTKVDPSRHATLFKGRDGELLNILVFHLRKNSMCQDFDTDCRIQATRLQINSP